MNDLNMPGTAGTAQSSIHAKSINWQPTQPAKKIPSRKSTPRRPRFKPVFTEDQVCSIESGYESERGIHRRCMLMILSRSGGQLTDSVMNLLNEGNEDVYFSLLKQITSYRNHLKEGVGLAEAAIARLLLTGEHCCQRLASEKLQEAGVMKGDAK